MSLIADIDKAISDIAAWRREIHSLPETAFAEHRTAAFVAERLKTFGLEVATGIGKTGVVGTLRRGDGNGAIGLRADLDALHIHEENTFAHRSQHDGIMHACGHDGHTAMLLGAARHLAAMGRFSGTIRFIFQPAEENEAGGRAMVEDGLFDRFPVDRVFGLHNWPALDVGKAAVRAGPVMASADNFEIVLKGAGGHAAMPHLGHDPAVAAAALVVQMQSIISRMRDPVDPAVISVTQIHTGETWNAIPDTATLRGTVRAFSDAARDSIEGHMARMTEHIAAAHDMVASFTYRRRYPPTVNDADAAAFCIEVLTDLIGAANVIVDPAPSMGAEDFAFMLEKRPGAYIWLGNRDAGHKAPLHNARYDFNDSALAYGIAYWIRLAETALPA